ncbi:MAG: cobyric acid synthase [Planctomycetota bacterium]|nr:cobyric acid synthase [Planctomycetota bacterium]
MGLGHGGNLRELARHTGLDRDAILDFSASVNPLGPPEGLRAVLARNIDRLIQYPDPDNADLVHLLAERYQVPAEQIVVGNGSSELLFAIARAGEFERAVIPVPAYIDYATAVQATGREVEFLAWPSTPAEPMSSLAQTLADAGPTSDEFTPRWPALESQLRGQEVVLLGQPNNPTGRLFNNGEFRDLAARHDATLFVVDEAFADFVQDYRSLIGQVPANVVVVRSLTKFYAIPGLRLGFAVAASALAQRIRQQIPPWSVNILAQVAAPALLADEDYARRTMLLVPREREQLSQDLARLPGLHVYPSVANYLLVRLDRDDCDAPTLAERLLGDGIAIRTFGPGQHLDGRFFRVAVRMREENQRLCDALAAALASPTSFRQREGEGPAEPQGDTGSAGASPSQSSRRRTPALMIQGTSSNAGKSILTAALCRILFQDGIHVAPFKSQNMSLNSCIARDGGEMGRAQVVQAQACRLEPDVRMNPILLKPNSDTGCQVIVRGQPVGNMQVGQYVQYKPQAFAVVQQCYDALAAEFDAIILEGAGSPGEVNLKSHDIVNMRMAEYARAPVVIVGDIDRGGVFAAFVGTLEVLDAWERRLVSGWIVNRFRGDASLLDTALQYTLERTGRPVLGVVPYLHELNLPQEDSVDFKCGTLDHSPADAVLEIAVIDLPHISNFTDFDAFRVEADVRLRIVRSVDELERPDAVIIPGSKNTLADLEYLRRSGLAQRLETLARDATAEIVGICAGFQILGREISDPLGIESSAVESRGLGLLSVSTVLAAEKTLVRTSAVHAFAGLEVTGYEIHHGQTVLEGALPLLTRPAGQVVGAATPDRRIWGTYLHGVFDADAFRRWFLDRLRVRRGLAPVGEATGRYDIEPALDRLADVVRQSLRMDEIYRLLGM